MDTYTACSIAEGFSGEKHTEEELNEAWQHLIDTGACWKLQGWYGRSALGLIQSGVCNPPPGYFLNDRGRLEEIDEGVQS